MNGGAMIRAISVRKPIAVCPALMKKLPFMTELNWNTNSVSLAFLHKGINFETEKTSSK